jgi:hypothetical protein
MGATSGKKVEPRARPHAQPQAARGAAQKCLVVGCNKTLEDDKHLLKHVQHAHGSPYAAVEEEVLLLMGITRCPNCLECRLTGAPHAVYCTPPAAVDRQELRQRIRQLLETNGLSSLSLLDHTAVTNLEIDNVFGGPPITTYKHVPQSTAVRQALTLVYSFVIERIVDIATPNRERDRWTLLLFSLPAWLQQVPATKGEGVSMTDVIAKRLELFLRGDLVALKNESQKNRAAAEERQQEPDQVNTEAYQAQRVQHLLAEGEISKAASRLASTAKVLSARDPKVQAALEGKFKLKGEQTAGADDDDGRNLPEGEAKNLEEADVKTALARTGQIGAGHSGMRISTLKMLAEQQGGLQLLTRLCNYVVNGIMRANIESALGQVVLTALSKSKPGDVRPVAVRETLLLVAGKAVLAAEQTQLQKEFGALQLAMGTQGGLEVAAHAVRGAHATAQQAGQELVTITADISNGYGSVRRKDVEQVAELLAKRKAAPLTRAYAERYVLPPTRVTPRGGHTFTVDDGVLQGDPLSPWAFCATVHPALVATREELGENGFMMAYIDDVVITAPPEAARRALQKLEEELAKKGMTIAEAKTQVLAKDETAGAEALKGLPTAQEAVLVLGVPVGVTPEAERKLAVTTAEEHNMLIEGIDALPRIQDRIILLRYSAGTKLNHLARAMPPDTSSQALQGLDDKITAALARAVMADTLDQRTRAELALPLTQGGLGVPLVEPLAPLAYFASVWAMARHPGLKDAPDITTNWLVSKDNRVSKAVEEAQENAKQVLAAVAQARALMGARKEEDRAMEQAEARATQLVQQARKDQKKKQEQQAQQPQAVNVTAAATTAAMITAGEGQEQGADAHGQISAHANDGEAQDQALVPKTYAAAATTQIRQPTQGKGKATTAAATTTAVGLVLPARPTDLAGTPIPAKLQHKLASAYAEVQRAKLFLELRDDAARAQFRSKTGPQAHLALAALPTTVATTYNNPTMVVALRTRYRMPLLPLVGLSETGHHCLCSSYNSSKDGIMLTEQHMLVCNNTRAWYDRHQAHASVWAEMAHWAHVPIEVEPKVHPLDPTDTHRYDFTVVLDGTRWCADITIRSPCTKNKVAAASRQTLHAAEEAVREKQAHYKRLVPPKEDNIIVLPAEVFGAMHPNITDLVQRICKRMADVPPEGSTWVTRTATAYWLQRLAAAQMRAVTQSALQLARDVRARSGLDEESGPLLGAY